MPRSSLTRAVPLGAVLATALALACVSPGEGAKGTACDRASDCAGGLFCVERTCTDDLSKLDGGNVPVFDMGSEAAEAGEAGDADGAVDTGKPVDTGTPPADTGTPPVDTGTPPVDTGTPPVDTGTPPVDTGTPPVDTGSAADTTAGD